MILVTFVGFANSYQPNYEEKTGDMSSYCSFTIKSGTSMNSVNYQLQVINCYSEITGQPAPWRDPALRHILVYCIRSDLHQGDTYPWSGCVFFPLTEEKLLVKVCYTYSSASIYLFLFSTQIGHSTWPSILEDFIPGMLW